MPTHETMTNEDTRRQLLAVYCAENLFKRSRLYDCHASRKRPRAKLDVVLTSDNAQLTHIARDVPHYNAHAVVTLHFAYRLIMLMLPSPLSLSFSI